MAKKLARNIAQSVLANLQPEGVGATVRRCISPRAALDPILMCDIFTVSAPAGFPDHPHRGFETVTYLLDGAIAHEDFSGAKGVIKPGDVQWMTAGRGIVHAEMPASKKEAHGVQLWLNLPARDKMCEPSYQDLKDADIPRATPEEGIIIKIIAGESFGVKSKVFTRTPAMIMDFRMAKGKKVEQPIPKGWSGFVYMLEGSGLFGGKNTKGDVNHTLFLEDSDEAEYLPIEAKDQDIRFMLVAAEPLKEPVISHGPFVMNTDEEIFNAISDFKRYQNGFERAKKFRSSIANGVQPLIDV